MIPDDFYLDTIVKQMPTRVCLYKSDRSKYIIVRSVYSLDSTGGLKDIKRYDLNNRLVHIYYPFGSRKPSKEWSDISVTEQDSTVIHYTLYEENEYISYNVYSKNGKLIEARSVNNTFSNNYSSITRVIIIYDSEGQPIIRTNLDERSQLISEERFYYNGNVLVKYTEDDNVSDSLLREEKIFNLLGQIVSYKSYNKYSGSVIMWKYYYDGKGLLKKDEYFLDGIHQLTRMYSYN